MKKKRRVVFWLYRCISVIFIMSIEEFNETLQRSEPNPSWSIQLQALWFEAKGDWTTGHDLIDQLGDRQSARVHAFFHRVEGDRWNARYWYRQADEAEYLGDLEEERQHLIQRFIAEERGK